MVSENQYRKIPNHVSKRNLGVTKQTSNSGLKKMNNALRMKDHDSLLMEFSREKINQGENSGARSFELRFVNDDKLQDMTFTKTNIIQKDKPLQVVLYDVRSNSIVNDGPFSSIKIQICPIKSEFVSCGDEDWTETEFKDNILHERENKEPLLIGDRFVTLKNGVASISEIMFTDNSGWERDKKFSLGAKAMKNGEIIKEGRSQALIRVKDVRGESYKKHYPPYLKLKDDVWRLKKIAKNGPFHERLRNNEIHNVKDLLRLLITNKSSLRQKFEKIQEKCWLAIVEHARSCVVDDYMLYGYEMNGQPVLLLFNVIYELVGVTSDAQKFYLPDDLTLTPIQKNLIEIVKKDAYKNIENLKAIDEGTLNSISLEACIKSTQDLQGYVEPFISTSNVNDGMQNVQINIDPVADTKEIPQNNYGDSTYAVIPEPDYDVSFGYFDGAELSTFFDFLSSDMDINGDID